MNRIQELVVSGEGPRDGDRQMLTELSERYPWFVYGRYMLMGLCLAEGDTEAFERQKSALSARLVYYPLPAFMLEKADGEKFRRFGKMNIVDDFLAAESHKIVMDEKKAAIAEDISQTSVAEPDGDMATETLAKVYLEQGLNEKAVNIYRKLSLKFPEKSIYFAAIIRDLEGPGNK